ncbi:MAG: PEP-CTERM sorting domain-containing protein [Thiobacillus sp.]|nr:PEP-CTERM sorting domain-containing protein [Thiobacillus sp.]
MKRIKPLLAGTFLLSQMLTGAAFAASVTLSGNTVDFSFDDTLLGLFGPAAVSGDTLYFTPVDFTATSSNGAGFVLTHDTVNIRIAAHSGWTFGSMGLTERGDYLLLGSGATADVGGQMRVFDIAAPLTDATAAIAPLAPLNLTGLPTHDWAAQASIDLSAWGSARSVNVTLENLLLASTAASPSLAFVEKKFVGLTPTLVAAPVPEAETYAMMLAGLGLVGFAVARRRRIG